MAMKASLLNKLADLVDRYEEIGALLSDSETIADQDQFRKLSMEYSEIEPVVKCFARYQQLASDAEEAQSMLDDGDEEMREMAQEELDSCRKETADLEAQLETLLLPKDPLDRSDVFLEIRAGTGGDEAAIFAGDLFRMYSRYAENSGWRVEVISERAGEHGGFKEIICRIGGQSVYGQLKFESGAHRVQRVPETESQGRVHTSACTVAILPEVAELDAIEINKADLRIDTFRASGAGGQHVNKTDSAVRLTHVPTNTVVQCQSERSQHQNRDNAWKMLKAKLYEMELQKRNSEAQAMEDSKSDIGWGSQIRSYVLDDQRIKDLRTNVQTSNCNNVLDGDLDMFIEASLKSGL